ncbi:MAG TPA: RNA polymerase sigma factor [Myxococcales bacterium]|nr:RNA polymerase sigma factor [Myxococcales bacterium]
MLPARVLAEPWTDQQVIARVLDGEVRLFELLMRRHNERIYRAVRSILRDEAEAEDAMQAAYLHTYAHLREFESRSAFATWLTRIAIHEALGRRRRALRRVTSADEEVDVPSERRSPEQDAEDAEHRELLKRAIDALPEHFRTVFVLREVQQLSVEETAEALDLVPETVKTRLHRARKLLRAQLLDALPRALPFEATRCDRVVAGVLARLGNLS